jgi:hypothetical protein
MIVVVYVNVGIRLFVDMYALYFLFFLDYTMTEAVDKIKLVSIIHHAVPQAIDALHSRYSYQVLMIFRQLLTKSTTNHTR